MTIIYRPCRQNYSGTMFVLTRFWPLQVESCLNRSHMGVSYNRGTPKSSMFMGFSFFNHPFWGTTILGNPHMTPVIAMPWSCTNTLVLSCWSPRSCDQRLGGRKKLRAVDGGCGKQHEISWSHHQQKQRKHTCIPYAERKVFLHRTLRFHTDILALLVVAFVCLCRVPPSVFGVITASSNT